MQIAAELGATVTSVMVNVTTLEVAEVHGAVPETNT